LDVDGAAVSLLTTSVARETLWASDSTANRLEELQFSLNEGAGIQAWLARPTCGFRQNRRRGSTFPGERLVDP
jgi:hypothetical protein